MPKKHPNPKNHAMACSSEEKAYQSSSLKTVAKEQESFFLFKQFSCLQLTFTWATGCILDAVKQTCQISFESLFQNAGERQDCQSLLPRIKHFLRAFCVWTSFSLGMDDLHLKKKKNATDSDQTSLLCHFSVFHSTHQHARGPGQVSLQLQVQRNMKNSGKEHSR